MLEIQTQVQAADQQKETRKMAENVVKVLAGDTEVAKKLVAAVNNEPETKEVINAVQHAIQETFSSQSVSSVGDVSSSKSAAIDEEGGDSSEVDADFTIYYPDTMVVEGSVGEFYAIDEGEGAWKLVGPADSDYIFADDTTKEWHDDILAELEKELGEVRDPCLVTFIRAMRYLHEFFP